MSKTETCVPDMFSGTFRRESNLQRAHRDEFVLISEHRPDVRVQSAVAIESEYIGQRSPIESKRCLV